MSKRTRRRNTERVYEMLGHTKAKEIAFADMRDDSEFDYKYMEILRFSVKEQLKCLNSVSIYNIDDLKDDLKTIPQPPKTKIKDGKLVSKYNNECFWSRSKSVGFVPTKEEELELNRFLYVINKKKYQY